MMVRSYKGYEGIVTFVDTDANLITGEVVNVQDGLNFQGRTPAELQAAFEESVDFYLDDCARRGVSPDRPFSGQLNVRLGPELHRAAHVAARLAGRSLNTWLKELVARETATHPGVAREAGAFDVRTVYPRMDRAAEEVATWREKDAKKPR